MCPCARPCAGGRQRLCDQTLWTEGADRSHRDAAAAEAICRVLCGGAGQLRGGGRRRGARRRARRRRARRRRGHLLRRLPRGGWAYSSGSTAAGASCSRGCRTGRLALAQQGLARRARFARWAAQRTAAAGRGGGGLGWKRHLGPRWQGQQQQRRQWARAARERPAEAFQPVLRWARCGASFRCSGRGRAWGIPLCAGAPATGRGTRPQTAPRSDLLACAPAHPTYFSASWKNQLR